MSGYKDSDQPLSSIIYFLHDKVILIWPDKKFLVLCIGVIHQVSKYMNILYYTRRIRKIRKVRKE